MHLLKESLTLEKERLARYNLPIASFWNWDIVLQNSLCFGIARGSPISINEMVLFKLMDTFLSLRRMMHVTIGAGIVPFQER